MRSAAGNTSSPNAKGLLVECVLVKRLPSLKGLSTDFKAFSSVATLTRLPSKEPNVGVAVPGLSLVL